MNKLLAIALGTAFLVSCASTSPGITGLVVRVEMPKQVEWSLISERVDNTEYTKEWAPHGEDFLTARWLITEQKLTLSSGISAKQLQKEMFFRTKKNCTDISFTGPNEILADGHDSSVGRVICAQQLGRPFGTFTDQRVIVDGPTAYVLTSELRIPKAAKAGELGFGKEQLGELEEFIAMQVSSSLLVRESVDISDH